MLAYVAIALSLGGAADATAHEQTYRIVREAVPARDYELLAEGTVYRRTTARDPEAFTQQLQFYREKLAYPSLIAVLTRVGMHPVRATVVLSRAGYLAIAVIIFVWISSFLSAGQSIATTWAIMSLPFTLDLARLSTPDAISTALVLAALWLLVSKERFRLSVGLLLLSIAVRPDNLLWLAAVGGYGAVHLAEWRASIAAVVAGTLSHAGLAAWSGNVGWPVQFYHSFIERMAYPATFGLTPTLVQYLRVYLRETHPVNLPASLLLFLFTGVLLFLNRLRQFGWKDRWVAVLVATGISVALHWLAFPEEDRILAPAYLLVLVLFVRTLAGTIVNGIGPTIRSGHIT